MGCVHTHWGKLIIERCGNPSSIQNIMEKFKEDNQNDGKTYQIIRQAPTKART
jgi:hypothetical protein